MLFVMVVHVCVVCLFVCLFVRSLGCSFARGVWCSTFCFWILFLDFVFDFILNMACGGGEFILNMACRCYKCV